MEEQVERGVVKGMTQRLTSCLCRLNDEARKLIAELGSTSVTSLGFRDSWVFVGGKGALMKNNFEKVTLNLRATS